MSDSSNAPPRLATTEDLRLAIRLLGMTLPELLVEIDKHVQDNPALSVRERTAKPIGPFAPDLVALPEVYVFERDGVVVVESNSNALPDLFVGDVQLPTFDDGDKSPVDVVALVAPEAKEHAAAAAWLGRSIDQRNTTYAKVVGEIARRATGWLRDEEVAPPRACASEVGDALGVHESNVARVLSGDKFLRCERGLLRLDQLLEGRPD